MRRTIPRMASAVASVAPIVGALAVAMMVSARSDEHTQQTESTNDQEQSGSRQTIRILAEDYTFKPSRIEVEPGRQLRIRIKNSGKNQHNIEFELPQGEKRLDRNLQPGLEGTLNFTAPQSTGEYVFYCPVGDHRSLGMVGRLIVTRSPSQQLLGSYQSTSPQEWDLPADDDIESGFHAEWEPSYTTQNRNRGQGAFGSQNRYQTEEQYGAQQRTRTYPGEESQRTYGGQTGRQTLRGEIVSVRPITFWDLQYQPVYTVAKVRLNDGRTIFIDLGPEETMEEYQLQPGDRLVARGRLDQVSGRSVLLADEVQIRGRSSRIDRSSGRNWEERQWSEDQGYSQTERQFRGGVQRFGESGGAAASTRQQVDRFISQWPQASRTAARDMIRKYGQPDAATEMMLVWNDNGIWKRTVVHRDPVQHNFPISHSDVLEQTIAMSVPSDKFDEIAEFDGSVIIDRTKGEVSARCDKEAMNILALNLAHEIVQGEKNVQEARQAYAKAVQQFQRGERPEQTQQLQFESSEQAQDPGEPVQLSEGGED